MLYATTRSKVETFTAQRALKSKRAPDGGLFVPARLPEYSEGEILGLRNQTAGECIARVMNLFFGTKLTGRDVDFRLGRQVFELVPMSHRITVAETWHNSDGAFGHTVRALTGQVSAELGVVQPGEWMNVAARIAVLFAVYGQLQREELIHSGTKIDAAVHAGDFITVMAFWYARKMGLPIGTIIVCCDEESGIWDLFARGQIRIEPSTVPTGLERLIYATLDWADVERYVQCCEKGGLFSLGVERHRLLREGMYACVISDKRCMSAISNVFRTNGYILEPDSAMVHAGLMDYRAITGEGGMALMLCEKSPVRYEQQVCAALGMGSDELHSRLNLL